MSLGKFLDPEPRFSAGFLILAQAAAPAPQTRNFLLNFPSPHPLAHSISQSSDISLCPRLHLHHPTIVQVTSSHLDLQQPLAVFPVPPHFCLRITAQGSQSWKLRQPALRTQSWKL